MPANNPTLNVKINEIKAFLQTLPDQGQAFLQEKFPGGLPNTRVSFGDNNPEQKYKDWYNSKFAVSAASSAKIAEVEKAAEQYRTEAEGAKKEAKVAKEQVQAVQQQLTTTTSDLQGQLVAQATAGDLVNRNIRLLAVQEQYRQRLVKFHDLVPVIDAGRWVLKIPYIKRSDGIRRFINIPFDSEAELDRVKGMRAEDAVGECALRNNDLVYLADQATRGTLDFDLTRIDKIQGYYAFALPIEYTDGRPDKDDAIVFSYDNQHDAEEGYRKAQFFMNIGAGKGGRSVQYKQVLTPRPARPTDEPQAVTALMDAYYLLLDGASKN